MKFLPEALQHLEYLDIRGITENVQFSTIAYNSSKVTDQSVFVAIRGTTYDGHKFIPDAIQKNAKVIICEEFPEVIPPDLVFIKVENSRKALAEISNSYYEFPAKQFKVIGITGTNGKTTTTFLIKSLLKNLGKKVAVIGTTGIFIDDKKIPATHTTPESLELFSIFRQIADAGIEYVIMEVSSHSLSQYRVHGIDFSAAIFTNLTHDHLDFHITMENYATAKRILFDNLSENAIAIINADDEYGIGMLQNCSGRNRILITRNTDLSFLRMQESTIIQIQNEKVSLSGISFKLNFIKQGEEHSIDVNSELIGKFNIDNLTYAISVIYGMALPITNLDKNYSFLQGAPGRMEVIKLPNGSIGIVDYAHTPDALEKALKTLNQIRNEGSEFVREGKIICVFGCGGNRDKEKRPVMGKIAGELSDYVIVTSDNPRTEKPSEIIEEIVKGIGIEHLHKFQIYENRHEAILAAYSQSESGDIILLAGKGHEDYQIIGNEKIHFDDKAELKSLN